MSKLDFLRRNGLTQYKPTPDAAPRWLNAAFKHAVREGEDALSNPSREVVTQPGPDMLAAPYKPVLTIPDTRLPLAPFGGPVHPTRPQPPTGPPAAPSSQSPASAFDALMESCTKRQGRK